MRALLQMTWAALLCVPLAAGAGAHAAAATATGQQPQQTAKQPAESAKTTTIVGCLVQDAAPGAGSERRSDAGTANANDYFVRTPSITAPVGSTVVLGKPTASPGTTVSPDTADSTALYRITGLAREQLRPHLGHRVELQGHLSGNVTPPTDPEAVAASGGTPTTAAPGSGSKGVAQRRDQNAHIAGVLHATTLKMVSATCP